MNVGTRVGDVDAIRGEVTDLPIVCTLSPVALRIRREGLLSELVRRADKREDFEEGYRLRLLASEDALRAVASAVDAERQCCRFLRFRITVEPDGGPIFLELSGPRGTREFLAA